MAYIRKSRRKQVPAVAYYRTSSAANVGEDKDTLKRQRAAVEGFAKANGYALTGEHYDAAVSGADPIEERPGFSQLLDRIEANGVRTVIVEDVSRFARDQKAHILGLALLRERGVTLLSADGHNLTDDTDEMVEAMISIMAVFAQVEKKRLVKKLKAARDRRSSELGHRVEGRKGYRETNPELVREAKRLAHGNRKERLSLRAIAGRLAMQGYLTRTGNPLPAAQVKRILDAR